MLLVAAAFVLLVLLGMPVAFAIGISGVLFFLQNPFLPLTTPVQLTVTQTQNFALLAVPLFIIAGNLLNHSGITERLLRLATIITGRLRGGLAQVTITLSALMGGVSGSAIADAAMQSRMLGGEMVRRGFPRGFTAAIISWSSLLTPVIPPGIGFILYGSIGQVSIGRLFAAGVLPALLLWLALAVAVSLIARRKGYQAELAQQPKPREVTGAFWSSGWAILFPIILLVGLRFGVFTPSEIGAFAVVYAAAVGVLAHRQLNLRNAGEALQSSISDVGAVMFLIAMSAILGYGIVFERVPDAAASAMLGLTSDPVAVMVLVAALLVVAGMVVDGSILIIMLTPILLPVARQAGIDPVHFGVVFVIGATLSNYTPPVGAAMYAVCSILRCTVAEYTRASIPLMVAILTALAALIVFPSISLWMPDLMFGAD